MKPNSKNDYYLKLIANIKSLEEFKCRKCGTSECYINKLTLARKCKKCKCVESVTANTAFAGLKIDISKAMEILQSFQEKYLEFCEEIEANEEDYFKGKLKSKYSIARYTSKEIGSDFDIRNETGWAFIERITKFMPREYWENSDANEKWFPNNDTSNKKYNALYNLLFDYCIKKREVKDILAMLVNKEFLEN